MEQVTQARDKVLDAIVEATEVPLPESVVTAEVESRIARRRARLRPRRGPVRGVPRPRRARPARSSTPRRRTEAEKRVRTRLVLDALADAEQVSVDDQELTERIIFQAQQYRMPPGGVRPADPGGGPARRDLPGRAPEQGADRRRRARPPSPTRRASPSTCPTCSAPRTTSRPTPTGRRREVDAEGASEADPAAVETAEESADATRPPTTLPDTDGAGATEAGGARPARGRPRRRPTRDVTAAARMPGAYCRQRTAPPCAVADRAVRVGSAVDRTTAMNTAEGRVK